MNKYTVVNYDLDDVDKKIIEMLKDNARVALKDIAKEVFLSSTAVSSRIDRLEKDGIISGYTARINPLIMGYNIKAFINIEVDPTGKKKFYSYIETVPNVVECCCVTGEYSMLIQVMFKTTSELDEFIGELQQFGKTKTQIVFSTHIYHRDII